MKTLETSGRSRETNGKAVRRVIDLCLLLVFIAVCTGANGQKSVKKHAALDDVANFTPARGYYRQLDSYSRAPQTASLEIDKKRYPSNSADEKRLNRKPIYLQEITVNDFKIPDPPANSSAQTRAELNYLMNLAKHRTSEDVRSSQYMSGVYFNPSIQPSDTSYARYRKNLFFIGRSIGTWFNPTDLPLTADLMGKVWQDANYFIWSFKLKYARLRPYMLEQKLNHVEEADAPSYPGGHATTSYVLAYLYQELAPEFIDVFVKDAFDMAHSREIIGVHYPSDSEVSRLLARQLVNKLLQNEKFLREFENVKREWVANAHERVD